MTAIDWPARARDLAPRFAGRAATHDREGSFPFENFVELREAGFFALTVPRELGGEGVSLGTFVRVQEELARGDGSTAMALNMHLVRIGSERDVPTYPARWFAELCRGALEDGWLCNTAATEEGLGSPAGGGLPDTTATPLDGGWRLDGRKTFTTLAPVLHYFIVMARVPPEEEGPARVADFVVYRDDSGFRIDETWDALGMRATGSHDIVLEDCRVPGDRLLHVRPRTAGEGNSTPWFALGVTATSIGVARAARDYAVAFARQRTPNSNRTISEYPGVRSRVARMDLLLHRARVLVGDAALAWDLRAGWAPETMAPLDRAAAAKVEGLNASIEVVELAMRVVGGVSMQRSRPLERYFRDVRAPLHNPPLEDRALEQLARAALHAGHPASFPEARSPSQS